MDKIIIIVHKFGKKTRGKHKNKQHIGCMFLHHILYSCNLINIKLPNGSANFRLVTIPRWDPVQNHDILFQN